MYNANGHFHLVTGDGSVTLTPSLSLSNTLLVPSLSNCLLFIGHITDELNCCVLTYPNFCLFQGILTKGIIGRGIKKKVLYIVDNLNFGCA